MLIISKAGFGNAYLSDFGIVIQDVIDSGKYRAEKAS